MVCVSLSLSNIYHAIDKHTKTLYKACQKLKRLPVFLLESDGNGFENKLGQWLRLCEMLVYHTIFKQLGQKTEIKFVENDNNG